MRPHATAVLVVVLAAATAAPGVAKTYPQGLDEPAARSITKTYLKALSVSGGTVGSTSITSCRRITWMTFRCSWQGTLTGASAVPTGKICTGIAQATRSKGVLHAVKAPGTTIGCAVASPS